MYQRYQYGFSLVELLMASVIVASAGALLVGGLVAANQHADARIDQILSTQALANQLALLDDPLSKSKTAMSGIASDEGHWTLQFMESDPAVAPLITTVLTVTRKGRTDHVVTYRRLTPES